MGRLFDAVASLAGICHRAGYDAQAAMELEARARPSVAGSSGVPASASVSPTPVDPGPVIRRSSHDVLAGARDPGWWPHGSSRPSSTWSSHVLRRLRDADRARHA